MKKSEEQLKEFLVENKVNKQLKKGSPLFDLGQGISSLLDFEAIGRASNPNRSTGTDLMGRGLIHLGAVMSKMDEDFDPGELLEGPTDETYEDPTFTDEEFDPNSVPVEDENQLDEDDLDSLIIDPKKPTTVPENKPPITGKKNTYVPDELGKNTVVRDTTGSGTSSTQQMIRTDIANNPEKLRNGFPTLPQNNNKKKQNIQLLSSGTYLDNGTHTEGSKESERLSTNKQKSWFQSTAENIFGQDVFKGGVNWFGEDDNPIKRLALEQPETFEAFKGLMYKRRHKGESPLRKIAHMHNSPFLKTDAADAQGVPDMSKVDYRYAQRAAIPGYAEQGFGQAAAEGFNLAIDRSNYKKAVQADYDKEVEDTMGELVIDSEYAGDSFNKQKLDFGTELKRQAYNDMVLYTKGEISFAEKQSRLDGYKNRAGVISAAGNSLAELSRQVQDEKGLHDLAASKPENAAFYNTLRDNPGAFRMETIDGQEYIVGKTMVNGQPADDVKMPLAQIASGKAALKLVPKTNPQTYVDAGLKVANGYVKEMATRFGIGKGNVSKEQIRPQMENYFMSLISQDETKLRSLAAQATNGKFDYDAFEQMINDTDPDNKKLNMQLLQNDIVQDMMLDFEAQYFPESQTVVRDPEKTGIQPASATKVSAVDKRAKEQTEAFTQQYDSLGEITPDNVNNLIDGKITNARINENGQLQVKIGKKQVTLSNDPAIRRQQIIQLKGGQLRYIK